MLWYYSFCYIVSQFYTHIATETDIERYMYMARASSGMQYPERFLAAASYAGFDESPRSSSKAVRSKFKPDSALLLYALHQQVLSSISFPIRFHCFYGMYNVTNLYFNLFLSDFGFAFSFLMIFVALMTWTAWSWVIILWNLGRSGFLNIILAYWGCWSAVLFGMLGNDWRKIEKGFSFEIRFLWQLIPFE